jgi:Mg2+ and Co2+ transporter CorA
MESNSSIHPSGLNIIENPDGSFIFEWDKNDPRWTWLNDLTDEEIKTIIEEVIQNPQLLEEIFNGGQNMGSYE